MLFGFERRKIINIFLPHLPATKLMKSIATWYMVEKLLILISKVEYGKIDSTISGMADKIKAHQN